MTFFYLLRINIKYSLCNKKDGTSVAINPIRDTYFASNPELYYKIGNASTIISTMGTPVAKGVPIEKIMATQTKRLASSAVGSVASNALMDRYDLNPYVAMGIGMGISGITYRGIESMKVDTTLRITASDVKGVDALGDVNTVSVDKEVETINTEDFDAVEIRTAEIANEEWFKRGYDKPSYKPKIETKIVKDGNKDYVRVFSYKKDGTSNKPGGWIMRKSDIDGLTPSQITDKYALPVEPTHICDIDVPKDFLLQTGIVNKADGWGEDGGQQFDIMGKRLPVSAFRNEKLILK